MHAMPLLRNRLEKSLTSVHAARTKCVFAAVDALLQGGTLTLTSLGRALSTTAQPKHAIKRVDRLLGNPRQHRDCDAWYRALSGALLGSSTNPIVIVDASHVCGEWHELRAAVPFQGRALTIYSKVLRISNVQGLASQKQFLKDLGDVLPPNCKPIMVSDAGFYSPWFAAVVAMGWHYVGRVRNRVHVRAQEATKWHSAKDLYPNATHHPKDLGAFGLSKSRPFSCRLILFKGKEKLSNGAKRKRPVCSQTTRRKAIKRAEEPWLLATSLESMPKDIVSIYKQRMLIEETFRDQKSVRFGWRARLLRSRDPNRLGALILIAALAQLAVLWLGFAAEAQNLHHRFQTNTVRSKRVLSLFTLGNMINRHSIHLISVSHLKVAWRTMVGGLSYRVTAT